MKNIMMKLITLNYQISKFMMKTINNISSKISQLSLQLKLINNKLIPPNMVNNNKVLLYNSLLIIHKFNNFHKFNKLLLIE